jgi:hypothetical protein
VFIGGSPLSFGAFGFLVAGRHFIEQGIETLEVLLPELTVLFKPTVQLLKRRGAQRVNPALRVDPRIDESRVAEHTQVFRDLGLVKMQAVDHVSNGAGSIAQEFDDVETVWLGQSF